MRVRFIKQHFGRLYCRILRQREDTPYFAPRCVIHRQIMTIDPLTDVPGLEIPGLDLPRLRKHGASRPTVSSATASIRASLARRHTACSDLFQLALIFR